MRIILCMARLWDSGLAAPPGSGRDEGETGQSSGVQGLGLRPGLIKYGSRFHPPWGSCQAWWSCRGS